jgi:hypothetical protein
MEYIEYMKNVLLLIFLSFLASECLTQNAVVFGRVTSSESKLSMMNVKVSCDLCSNVVLTDINGEYSLDIPAGKATKINYDKEGYQAISYDLEPISQDGKRYINIYLAEDNQKIEVVIRASKIDDGGMVREKVTEFKVLPTASGNFESVLPSIALGVNAGSGGELSSQYNVRGGNYDENLVYINDFEIFRPQLIRASQQEGLSFPNIDLIRDIKFSSGGYDATYGNKMSSVLDIKYKRPDQFRSSISGSLLGLNGHIEGSKRLGSNAYNKFRYLIGARYKTNAYLLGTQDVKGEYIPDFIDVQAYLTYDISRSLQLAYLGNYNSSVFNFSPLTRNTTLGLLTNAIRLSTAYEGGEKDKFLHGLNGLSFNFVPDRKEIPYFIKVMASRYSGSEAENFDILGYYRLAQIDTDQNSSTFNQELSLLGTGVQHRYARNYLYNEIYNGEIKTGIEIAKNNKTHFIEAGLKYQTEIFEDYINEWERLDSAGYSLPYTGKEVAINKVLKTSNDINNQKLDFFVQDKLTISKERYKLNLTGGIRYTNIAFTKENLISPRVAIDYFPSTSSNISYRLAAGRYYQASFYREFRLIGGGINQDAKSQESIHLVGGINYDFMWKSRSRKPFKLLSEIYYKKMSNLISYDVDNVRIAYSGKNDSKGYATGIDFRINGEFVPDAESWVNVGFLRTRESIEGVTHKTRRDTAFYTIADVPRSTDRFFNINLFFQDYLPKNKNFKANVAYSYASGLPFGIKDNNIIARNIFRYKPYQRLDIGFSYMLFDKSMSRAISPNNPFRNTEKTWISLEVFNIMNYTNTASITWIKTITNDQYAINNYLTGRRVNLRFRIDF